MQSLFETALAFHQSGLLAKAEELYRQILDKEPSFADAWHLLGVIALQTDHPQDAVDLIVRAIGLRPDVSFYHNNLGAAFQSLGKHEAAVQSFNQALKLQPDYIDASNNLGHNLKALGRTREAMEAYRTVVRLNPRHFEAQMNLGALCKSSGNLPAAADAFCGAVASDERSPEAHNNLGNILLELGRLEEAREHYMRALQLRPHDAAIRYNLARISYLNLPVTQWAQVDVVQDGLYGHEGWVRKAIAAWCAGRSAQASAALAQAQKLSKALGDLADPNLRNMKAYERFLSELIKTGSQIQTGNLPVLSIIGDSHTLSYAQLNVLFAGQQSRIAADLIVGCKAWHLAREGSNSYKRAFQAALSRLSPGASFLVSVGEIDCRMDEGILPYWQKHGGDLGSIIERTARGAMAFVSEAARKQGAGRAFFCLVPAPHIAAISRDAGRRMGEDEAEALIDLIRRFNDALKDAAQTYECGVVDLYTLTASRNGAADGAWHIDQFHLKPGALARALAGLAFPPVFAL